MPHSPVNIPAQPFSFYKQEYPNDKEDKEPMTRTPKTIFPATSESRSDWDNDILLYVKVVKPLEAQNHILKLSSKLPQIPRYLKKTEELLP